MRHETPVAAEHVIVPVVLRFGFESADLVDSSNDERVEFEFGESHTAELQEG